MKEKGSEISKKVALVVSISDSASADSKEIAEILKKPKGHAVILKKDKKGVWRQASVVEEDTETQEVTKEEFEKMLSCPEKYGKIDPLLVEILEDLWSDGECFK